MSSIYAVGPASCSIYLAHTHPPLSTGPCSLQARPARSRRLPSALTPLWTLFATSLTSCTGRYRFCARNATSMRRRVCPSHLIGVHEHLSDPAPNQVASQVNEVNIIRQALYELESTHQKVRQDYENEVTRLRAELRQAREMGGPPPPGPQGYSQEVYVPRDARVSERDRMIVDRERDRERDQREPKRIKTDRDRIKPDRTGESRGPISPLSGWRP